MLVQGVGKVREDERRKREKRGLLGQETNEGEDETRAETKVMEGGGARVIYMSGRRPPEVLLGDF